MSMISTIHKILQKDHGISADLLGAASLELPLTGPPFYLRASQMVYLLFELEKHYHVRIPSDVFDHYGMSSIQALADAFADAITDAQSKGEHHVPTRTH